MEELQHASSLNQCPTATVPHGSGPFTCARDRYAHILQGGKSDLVQKLKGGQPCPGWVARVVRVSSRYVKVEGLIPGEGI